MNISETIIPAPPLVPNQSAGSANFQERAFGYDMSYLKRHRDSRNLPPRPPMFRPSTGAEVPLAGRLLQDLGPLQQVPGCTGPAAAHSEQIATVAHYTLGLSRYEPTEPYFLHRPSPSPRCFFASELFLADDCGDWTVPGIHRYNPVRHSLESVSPAEGSALLKPDTPGPFWAIRLHPERLSHIYGDFAVRLALLEAGHVAAQLQEVSARVGLPLQSELDPEGASVQNLRAGTLAPLARFRPGPAPALTAKSRSTVQPPGAFSFRQALLSRASGHGPFGVDPQPCTLEPSQLQDLAAFAVTDADANTPLSLYAVSLQVRGEPPGVSVFDPDRSVLRRLRDLDLSPGLFSTLFTQYGFQARHCPAFLFIVLEPASDHSGRGGYARGLMAAGRAAQRLGWLAARDGLFARPNLSYDEAAVDRLLDLRLRAASAVYAVALGRDRDRGFPVRLAL